MSVRPRACPRPLTDAGFLNLSRDVKRRHDPDARLGSVHALSQSAIRLLTLVLCIPPYGGGTGLRSQQLLRLTDLVGDALPGYDLSPASVKLCVTSHITTLTQ